MMNAILLCAALCAQASAPPDSAQARQNPQILEQQLEDAREENRKLRDELAAAQKRVKELESKPAAPPTPSVPAAHPSAPRADPTAEIMGNPIAVLDFFNKKFAQDMAKKHIALAKDSDSKATRQAYLSNVKDWIQGINRTRYSIEWRGRVTELPEAKGPNQPFGFQCVSPDNKSNFGRVIFATILRSDAPQLGTQAPEPDEMWRLIATLKPTLTLNPDMLEPNTFDNPPLVGPCVEFQYRLEVTRLFPEKNPDASPGKKSDKHSETPSAPAGSNSN